MTSRQAATSILGGLAVASSFRGTSTTVTLVALTAGRTTVRGGSSDGKKDEAVKMVLFCKLKGLFALAKPLKPLEQIAS